MSDRWEPRKTPDGSWEVVKVHSSQRTYGHGAEIYARNKAAELNGEPLPVLRLDTPLNAVSNVHTAPMEEVSSKMKDNIRHAFDDAAESFKALLAQPGDVKDIDVVVVMHRLGDRSKGNNREILRAVVDGDKQPSKCRLITIHHHSGCVCEDGVVADWRNRCGCDPIIISDLFTPRRKEPVDGES